MKKLYAPCHYGRFSNIVLQALMVLVKKAPPGDKSRRLLVMGTTSQKTFLEEAGLAGAFQVQLTVPLLSESDHLRNVLSQRHAEKHDFPPEEVDLVCQVGELVGGWLKGCLGGWPSE